MDRQHQIFLYTIFKAWLYLRPLNRDELMATLRTSLEDALMTYAGVFHTRASWEQSYLPTACRNKLEMVWYAQCYLQVSKDVEADRRRGCVNFGLLCTFLALDYSLHGTCRCT
jgi:hypothetical protein